MESTVTGHSYLDMLENFAVPQKPSTFIFEQDGAPPHFSTEMLPHFWMRLFLMLGPKRRSYFLAP
jgi:hypothetical protein